jgi:hypothetical protein
MTAFSKVCCARLALGATLLACACGRDADALFDDSVLTGQSGGGSGPATAGSQGIPVAGEGGEQSGGGADTAGSSSEGGRGGSAAGTDTGGTTSGGASTAGSAGKPGAGEGGTGGSAAGMAGTGGKDPDPEPITVVITTFDDSYIASCMAYSNFGSALTLNVDDDNNCVFQSLLAPSLEELPQGAIVTEAKLTLHCINDGGAISLNYVDDAWQESEVRYMGRPDVGTSIGTVTCKEEGPVTLDLTAVVEVWLAAVHPAYGIYLRTEAQDGTDFASSEAVDAATRPSLSVTYKLPTQ